eukprot:1151996-Pelagomonas_calceolata.AAC.6
MLLLQTECPLDKRIPHTNAGLGPRSSLPRGAQGVGPESRQNACQNGALRKLPPVLPEQLRWLGTSSRAYFGVSGGPGVGARNHFPDLNFGRENGKKPRLSNGSTNWRAD